MTAVGDLKHKNTLTALSKLYFGQLHDTSELVQKRIWDRHTESKLRFSTYAVDILTMLILCK